MSAICFHTDPKGGVPHYSYIFTNPDPLGMEINNVSCSRLGTMLQLETQKVKEAMKAEIFNRISEGLKSALRY